MATVQFRLNGKSVTFAGDVERMLLWILRTDLALTGAKYGFGEGLCGACTVLVDGEADARGTARDERRFTFELEIHSASISSDTSETTIENGGQRDGGVNRCAFRVP